MPDQTFPDFAKGLDPMMPAEQYDQVRMRWFNENVKPKLGADVNLHSAWDRFRQNTERPQVKYPHGRWADLAMVGLGKATADTLQGANKLVEDAASLVTGGYTGGEKKRTIFHDWVEKQGKQAEKVSDEYFKLAKREGKTTIPYYVGEAAGYLAGFEVSEVGAAKLASLLRVGKLAEASPFAARVVKGGLSFGIFNAAFTTEGDRLTAGARGFAEGMALDGALGLLGKAGRAFVNRLRKGGISDKEVDKIVTNVLSGDVAPPPEIDQSISDAITHDVGASRLEGRPQFIKEDPSIKGVRVLLHDAQGRANTVLVRPGEEASAVKEILSNTRQGFIVDGILHNPNSIEQLQRFMRASADAGAGRYEGVKVLRTAEGQAPTIALERELDAKPTAVVSESEILTQEPHFGAPDEEKIKSGVAALRDAENYPLSKGARDNVRKDIETLWNEKIPDQRKALAAKRLQQWDLKDLIPDEWRSEPEAVIPEAGGEDILKRAKELGVSEAELARLEEISGKEPERVGRKRREGPFEEGLQASMTWETPREVERPRPFDIEHPTPTEPVKGEAPTEKPPLGAFGEFFPEAEKPWRDLTHSEEGRKLENELYQQAKTEVGESASFTEINNRFQQLKREFFEREAGLQPMRNILVPPSEEYILEEGLAGPTKVSLGITPRRYALQVSAEQMRRLVPGAEAITGRPGLLPDILERLDLPTVVGGAREDLPTIAYKQGAKRATVYHEGLHVDKFHTPGAEEVLFAEGNAAADSIARGLKQSRAYRFLSEGAMREEAFVHAATAIRHNDVASLQELVKMDGSVGDVFEMVNQRAAELWGKTVENVDSVASRILQRKMSDLILRTTDNRAWELMDRTADAMVNWEFDPAGRVWRLRSPESLVEEVFSDLPKLADALDKKTGSEWAPSASLFAEAKGIRGPIVPRGGAPVKNPVSMDTPPDAKWSGWTAVSGWMRPMGPWVADLHTRVNDALSKVGKRLPIYERWKDVDDAFKAGEQWMQDTYESAAQLLKGIKNEKQYAYFDVLATDPQYHEQVAKKLGLDANDIARIGEIDKWLDTFKSETNINPKNYLRDQLPRLRGSGYSIEKVYGRLKKTPSEMSTFERLITEGKIDPHARHIGSFMNTMIKEGFSQKFSDQPLKALEKLVRQQTTSGQYVLGNMRHPLENYVKYMRNIPDPTQQVLNKMTGEFFGFVGEKFAQMNKHLPSYAQLPEKFDYPRSILNKMMIFSYAGGLGLRASIPLRDFIQVFTTSLPVLGGKKFANGLYHAFEGGVEKAWQFSADSGALLRKRNIGDIFGDFTSEIPVGASQGWFMNLANKLLAPSRWGHNLGRHVMFQGEYHSALEAVKAFREGKMGVDDFIKDGTSLWFNDKPVIERMLGQLHDTGFSNEEVAKNIALETLDLTLWPYRRGTQPGLLRTGAGRIFGQFGMWPMNYLDYMKRMALKTAEYPANAAWATATWAGINFAAVQALNGIGADNGKWFWFSPAAIEMSPHAKFVIDLAGMWKDSEEGREARKRVFEYPLIFFPTSVEMTNISKGIDNGDIEWDNMTHDGWLRILGFTPKTKEEPDRELPEEIYHQMGEPYKGVEKKLE